MSNNQMFVGNHNVVGGKAGSLVKYGSGRSGQPANLLFPIRPQRGSDAIGTLFWHMKMTDQGVEGKKNG